VNEKKDEEKRRRQAQVVAPFGDFDWSMREWMQPFWRHQGTGLMNLMGGFNSVPSMDVVDNGDSFTVKADMPGVEKKNIKLRVTARSISISAEKSSEKETKGKNYYSRERSSTGYYREMALPDNVKAESAKAKYEEGILTIQIKKARPAQSEGKEVSVD
jgi:HSP20 family protein